MSPLRMLVSNSETNQRARCSSVWSKLAVDSGQGRLSQDKLMFDLITLDQNFFYLRSDMATSLSTQIRQALLFQGCHKGIYRINCGVQLIYVRRTEKGVDPAGTWSGCVFMPRCCCSGNETPVLLGITGVIVFSLTWLKCFFEEM